MRIRLMLLLIGCSATAVLTLGLDVKSERKVKAVASDVIKEGINLSIAPEEETVTAGEPINLKIRLKNDSTKALRLAVLDPEREYILSVVRGDKVEVQLTRRGQAHRENAGDFNHQMGLLIEPGQVREDVLEVSALYEMTTPETYSIAVSRRVGKVNNTGQELIESNTVKVKVTPKNNE